MTDINVITTAYQVERRSWYLGTPDNPGFIQSVTLDVSAFNAAHYPNGYIPSGTVLGKITATGLYGPYTTGASDGTQTAVVSIDSGIFLTSGDGPGTSNTSSRSKTSNTRLALATAFWPPMTRRIPMPTRCSIPGRRSARMSRPTRSNMPTSG